VHIFGDLRGGIRFVFADGTQALLSARYSNFTGSQEPTIIYYTSVRNLSAIDNITQKPTRERFYFKINDKGMVIPPHMNLTREQNLINCRNVHTNGNNDYGTNGYTDCFTLIYKDGWKISDDYPW